MNGVGGTWAPNLTHEARRHPDAAWQIAHLKNPPSESPGSAMPPFAGLPTKTLSALAAYLVTRK
jgi:cbb3-type cytochrome oxidase cytochrome c subunit